MLKRRPPFRTSPMRVAAEFLTEQNTQYVVGFMFLFALWIMTFVYMLQVWSFQFLDAPPNPWVATVFGFVVSLVLVVAYGRLHVLLERNRKGMHAEKIVAEKLEELRPYGYTPFHDVQCRTGRGTCFNIDHILIGPAGVFAVETKYRSKPERGSPSLKLCNDVLADRGFALTKEVAQAEDSALFLSKLLSARMGVPVHARALLVYPGWFVDPAATQALWNRSDPVAPLNEKAVGAFLGTLPQDYSETQRHATILSIRAYIEGMEELPAH